jgi:hypothetical protein
MRPVPGALSGAVTGRCADGISWGFQGPLPCIAASLPDSHRSMCDKKAGHGHHRLEVPSSQGQSTAGMGWGVNLGAGLQGTYVPGNSDNISGTTLDLNGNGPLLQGSGSISANTPMSGSVSGGVSVGLPLGASLTTTHTGHFGWLDLKKFLHNHFGSNPCP